jgi:hypothetical protein
MQKTPFCGLTFCFSEVSDTIAHEKQMPLMARARLVVEKYYQNSA